MVQLVTTLLFPLTPVVVAEVLEPDTENDT